MRQYNWPGVGGPIGAVHGAVLARPTEPVDDSADPDPGAADATDSHGAPEPLAGAHARRDAARVSDGPAVRGSSGSPDATDRPDASPTPGVAVVVGAGTGGGSGPAGGSDLGPTILAPDRSDDGPFSFTSFGDVGSGIEWVVPSVLVTVPGFVLIAVGLAQLFGGSCGSPWPGAGCAATAAGPASRTWRARADATTPDRTGLPSRGRPPGASLESGSQSSSVRGGHRCSVPRPASLDRSSSSGLRDLPGHRRRDGDGPDDAGLVQLLDVHAVIGGRHGCGAHPQCRQHVRTICMYE